MFFKKDKNKNENENEEEAARENGFTMTIVRNSDGKILHLIQGTSIFAGVAMPEKEGRACSIILNEGSTGMETFSAAAAAEAAIKKYGEKDKKFNMIWSLKQMAENDGIKTIVKELGETGDEDDE